MVMTIFAGFSLWLSSGNPKYVFWLGALAMAQIAIIFTGILGLLVKRVLTLSRTQFSVSDFDPDDELIPRSDAVSAVEEAVQSVPEVTTNGLTDQSSGRNQ
jgi:hypothetical protein